MKWIFVSLFLITALIAIGMWWAKKELPTPSPSISAGQELAKNQKESELGQRRDEITKEIVQQLVLIPAGKLIKEGKEHEVVAIPSAFYMGKFEVTQKQYNAIMGVNSSRFKGEMYPVDNISWDDAQAFCKTVSHMTGRTVRLPTSDEWEYAARAGVPIQFPMKTDDHFGDQAWFGENSHGATHPVGGKQPNLWGLHDMYGNVWEWCQDAVKTAREPAHFYRGGSWNETKDWQCRSARAIQLISDKKVYDVGIRIVVE